MPKVSICIPTYNQTVYLKKSIDSVIAQTYTDYEIIITDDTPGDMVKDLVDQYQLPEKIKYYKNPISLGSPENWNEAIRVATGKYIKILHHDDWFNFEDSLEKYVGLLENNPGVDFAFSATQVKSSDGNDWVHRISNMDVEKIEENSLNIYCGILIGAPSAVIFKNNKTLFFDANLKWLVDIEFYLRQLLQNKNVAYSPELLVVTFEAEGRVTDECRDNKMVELFEYFYTLETIYNRKEKYHYRYLNGCLIKAIDICNKYRVKNYHDVRDCGFTGRIHTAIGLYLKLNIVSPLLATYFKKILRRL